LQYRVDAPSHTYAEEGNYTVTVTVKHDQLPAITSIGQSITIDDAQVAITSGAAVVQTITENSNTTAITGIVTFTDQGWSATESPAPSYTALIDWGDGTTSMGSVVNCDRRARDHQRWGRLVG
jgi:PKD repeat protein